MKNKNLEPLIKYLRKEEYPYQLGTIRGFALSLIKSDDSRLIEEFRMRSAGQGVNSRSAYERALNELQAIPGLIESLENLIPFPTLSWDDRGDSQVIVEIIPLQVALERIEKYS